MCIHGVVLIDTLVVQTPPPGSWSGEQTLEGDGVWPETLEPF